MKEPNLSTGVVPIGAFKGQAARWLRHAAESGEPVVITQHGRPAAVLVSPAEFDRMRERERFLESIAAGIADVDAGRVMSGVALRARLTARRTG